MFLLVPAYPGCPRQTAVKWLLLLLLLLLYNAHLQFRRQIAFNAFVHRESKKQDTRLLPITSPKVNRFSELFHCQTSVL